MQRQETQIDQTSVIHLGIALGYGTEVINGELVCHGIEERGVCEGTGLIGVMACLVEDMPSFNKRIKYIKFLFNKDRKVAVRLFKESMEDLAKNARNKQLSKRQRRRSHIELLDQKAVNEKQFYMDVTIFIENICTFYNHKYWRSIGNSFVGLESRYKVLNLIGSIELEKRGGVVQVFKDTRLLTQYELQQYFLLLDGIVREVQCSIAVTFRNENHVIAIFYDAKIQQWHFIDANNMPIKPCAVFQLVELVATGLFQGFIVGFNMSILTTGQQKALGRQVAKKFRLALSSNSLYLITPQMGRLSTCHGLTMMWLATLACDAKMLKKLSSFKSTTNVLCINLTPVLLAYDMRCWGMLDFLIKQGCDMTIANSHGQTLLDLAVRDNYSDLIKKMYLAGYNFTKPVQNSSITQIGSAIDIAEICHKVDVLQFLYKIDTRSWLTREIDGFILNCRDPQFWQSVKLSPLLVVSIFGMVYSTLGLCKIDSQTALIAATLLLVEAAIAAFVISVGSNYYKHQSLTLFSKPKVPVNDPQLQASFNAISANRLP